MSHENQEPQLSNSELVAHLWRRRFLLLFAPLAVAVATYLVVRAFGGETFESTALVYLRDRPVDERTVNTTRANWIDPPSYRDILGNDELLRGVVDAGRRKFPEAFGDRKYEELKVGFRVRTVTTRDTAVTTTFSPVIELVASGAEPEVAHFLVSEWLDRALRLYGAIGSGDAIGVTKAVVEQSEIKNNELADARRHEAELDYEIDRLKIALDAYHAMFYEKNVRATLSFNEAPSIDRNGREIEDPDAATWKGQRLGLFEQRAQTLLQIAELEAVAASQADEAPATSVEVTGKVIELAPPDAARNHARLVRLRARLAAIEDIVEQTNDSIVKLNEKVSKLEGEVARARSRRTAADNAMRSLNEMFGFAVADSILVPDSADPERQGALRVLSHPVVPEKRVGPKRAIISAAAGIAAIVFFLLSIVAEAWIRKSVGEPQPEARRPLPAPPQSPLN